MVKKRSTSVIVSLFNYEKDVESLYDSLNKVMKPTGSFELIFVDDGSTDETYSRLAAIARKKRDVRVVRMRSSFGEAACLEAGLKYSSGHRIVWLTGRVRVNPEGIPLLLESLDGTSDLVVGWRSPRRDAIMNRCVSSVFNRLAGRISRVKLHDINSGILVTSRPILEKISFYGDLYNFIPILAAQQGYRVTEMKIEQLPGTFRKSKYPGAYLERLLDIITVFFLSRYSKKPIHFLGFLGSLFMLLGMGILGYLFIYRILQMGPIAGRPLLILGALLLVIGIQMISIGLLGEMIIFTHARNIEEYNILEVINE